MKTLLIDCETAPIGAEVWGLWNQNVGLPQITKRPHMLSFSYDWYGDANPRFVAEWQRGGHAGMVAKAYKLINEADVLVHYNGVKFDEKWFNTEFALHGYTAPSPFKRVDLLSVVKTNFRFPSNKLEYIAQAFGIGGKVVHTGHQLWQDVVNQDREVHRPARKLMEVYNKQDVALLDPLFRRLHSWIKGLPNAALYDDTDGDACSCGSTNLRREGYAYTALGKFQQYQCKDCGHWLRSGKRIGSVDLRPAMR